MELWQKELKEIVESLEHKSLSTKEANNLIYSISRGTWPSDIANNHRPVSMLTRIQTQTYFQTQLRN